MSCGFENSHFDERAFEDQFGVTLEEEARFCNADDHSWVLEILEDDPEFLTEKHFCFVCGARIT